MREGWDGEDYLVLFAGPEVEAATQRYGVSQAIPGHRLVGLRSWDDFIVQDAAGRSYAVPTVPLEPGRLAPFALPAEPVALRPDERLAGRIKWYVKPVVFGGDPNAGDNLTWVTHEQHAQLVAWWNDQYRKLKAQGAGR